MPNILKDLTGQKFYHLTVIRRHSIGYKSSGKPMWECLCECGNTKIARGSKLKEGEVKSCGCFKKQDHKPSVTTHGKSKTPIWYLWRGIKTRCLNKNASGWHRYGGRGIKMHEPWMADFDLFFNDLPSKPISDKRLTLDRIDNNKGYEPGNIRWATYCEQNNNKGSNVIIEIDGIKKTQAEWNRFFGKSTSFIQQRARHFKKSKESVVRELLK